MLQPVLDRWDPAEVVLHMLLADRAHRDGLAVAVRQRRPEDRLAKEDAFAVMPQRPVANVGNMCLALVEPVMDGEIVARHAAEQLRRADRVVIGMSHDAPYSSMSIFPRAGSALGSSVIVQASR